MPTPTKAAQDPATTILQSSERTKDADKFRSLGARLMSPFGIYEQDSRLAEMRWANNARQYIGIYDHEV